MQVQTLLEGEMLDKLVFQLESAKIREHHRSNHIFQEFFLVRAIGRFSSKLVLFVNVISLFMV